MPFPAASATLQLRLSAIRLWYGFLIYQDICSLNPSASFVKADRVAHMMSVLIDHDPDAVSLTGPAIYYDLGDSYCMNPFWSNCPHRMACIGCDFNLPKQSTRGLLLESKASVKRYLEEVPLTVDERAVVEGDTVKLEATLRKSGKVLIW